MANRIRGSSSWVSGRVRIKAREHRQSGHRSWLDLVIVLLLYESLLDTAGLSGRFEPCS